MVLKHYAEATSPEGSAEDPILNRLKNCIEHASHLLPAQGPISVFIHHNTLHAFEHLPFKEATRQAARVFGCEPYPTEARFHTEMAKGRILPDDLRAAIRAEYGEGSSAELAPGIRRSDLMLAMLSRPIWSGTPAELRWKIAEDDIPRRFARLWQRCAIAVRACPESPEIPGFIPLRDSLLRAGAADPGSLVGDLLIRYSAAFLDQGLSRTPLPNKEAGFFRVFTDLYSRSGFPGGWRKGLARLCVRAGGSSPLHCILESLAELGVTEDLWIDALSATMLELRGWGGMIHHVEERGDRVHHPIPEGSFVEFIAVRLLLDRAAITHLAREELGYAGPLPDLRSWLAERQPPPESPNEELRVYEVFQAARALGLAPDAVAVALAREALDFTGVKRRWVFLLAYERHFRLRTLDALAHRVEHPAAPLRTTRFQVLTCLDEREESFRRHLEEVAPDCETFGTAGFFAAVMYYRGVAQAHYTPLCPVVVRPKHWVEERPCEPYEDSHRKSRRMRRALGRSMHQFHLGTRGLALGAILAAGLGALATFPLVARVLFPGLTARLRRRAGRIVAAPKKTRLQLERSESAPGPEGEGVGFSVEEMTGIGERLLRDIGLTRDFARLVFTLGHGSHSMNNPHESAHDCGACGGAVGGPNGRAIAQILNDPRVRAALAGRGIPIPAETHFVGGLHNTCNEYVKFADTESIPATHRAEFEAAGASVEEAIGRNAHERTRRFDSAPLDITPAMARAHLDARAEDLAQVRPEWGHATNAFCVVGRRERTRGLYLDRRPFLASYDPTQDDADASILARTLAAVFPVCAGINLEYYFSHVDPRGYGSGTKLPHNITALLGVMDGAASDLRTGLPWQMTEIHEPVRLLIVIETTAEIFRSMMHGNATVDGLARKGWVQVALMHPATGALSVFDGDNFVPHEPSSSPLRRAGSSVEWYGGKRDHLEFVEISRNGATPS